MYLHIRTRPERIYKQRSIFPYQFDKKRKIDLSAQHVADETQNTKLIWLLAVIPIVLCIMKIICLPAAALMLVTVDLVVGGGLC